MGAITTRTVMTRFVETDEFILTETAQNTTAKVQDCPALRFT